MRYVCQTDKATIYVQDHAKMDHFPRLKEDIKRTGATHVVTEVQYGAEITCVFTKKKTGKENLTETQASLNAEVGTGHVGTETSTTIKQRDMSRNSTSNVRCSVSADILIQEDITSIRAAKELLTKVPARLNENTQQLGSWESDSVRGVATKVVLYPLVHLHKKFKSFFKIDQVVLLNIKKQINEFNKIISSAKEMIEEGAANQFPHIRGVIEQFVELVEEGLDIFKGDVKEMLIKTRNTTDKNEHKQNMEELNSKIDEYHKEFIKLELDKWLDQKEKECSILESIMDEVSIASVSDETEVMGAIILSKNVLVLKFHLHHVMCDDMLDSIRDWRNKGYKHEENKHIHSEAAPLDHNHVGTNKRVEGEDNAKAVFWFESNEVSIHHMYSWYRMLPSENGHKIGSHSVSI